uniref:Uncharacterized protein n=1 Tax=Anguilla anguilla TaxID=7936 RepID=A0A0E9QF31_ANGAN
MSSSEVTNSRGQRRFSTLILVLRGRNSGRVARLKST